MSSCTSSTQVNERLRSTGLAKGRDCISNLPECVLSHILSRLTAKEAVRTCVLSKHWERKWISVYNINIKDTELYKEKSSKFLRLKSTKTNFSNFVERLLLVSQNVKKFRLSCIEDHEASRVISWISTILRRNVENLDVEYHVYGITLPPRLLSCTSLRKLKLKLNCTLTVPIKSSLPRLSALYLDRVEMQNENPQVDTLRFNFPMLETFELRECTWLNVKLVDIYAPKLTTFTYRSPSLDDRININNYRIKITAERLAKFESSGYVPENISVVGTVTYAYLSYHVCTNEPQMLEQLGTQFRKLLKGISSSEKLMISGFSAKALEHSKRVPLPVFQKLQRLTLYSGNKAEVFVELLTAAIYLKYLNASMGNMDDYDYDQVKPVPHCLLSLETVTLNYFTGTTGQLNLAKFLLGNGIVLKKVYVSCASWHRDKDKIVEQLSTFPKCSPCLMLIVT